MNNPETVFLTTIFPASKPYLNDFFKSLQNQTYKNFDILVINDGIDNFSAYKTQYSDLKIIECISEQTPAKNRESGINKTIELGYKNIILGDSDDYFSNNRIQKSVEALQNNKIVVNDINLFYDNKSTDNFFTNNLKNINLIQENILDANVFGFSNIAFSSDIINLPVKFDDNLIAVDWYFITTLLINHPVKLNFLDGVQTYYRQHENNTIGMSMLLTEKKLELGLNVKQKHYYALIEYCKTNKLENKLFNLEHKLKQIQDLKEKLSNAEFKEKYISIVNASIKQIFSGWWSEIMTLEEFYKYENQNK